MLCIGYFWKNIQEIGMAAFRRKNQEAGRLKWETCLFKNILLYLLNLYHAHVVLFWKINFKNLNKQDFQGFPGLLEWRSKSLI